LGTDDRSLLARAATGDAGALEILMTRYSARVFQLAYGITRSAADAEEVAQDVFLQIVHKGAGFEGRAALDRRVLGQGLQVRFDQLGDRLEQPRHALREVAV